MHVLVTGASGFIGSHLVSALRAAGHRVRAVTKSEPRPERRVDGVEYLSWIDVSDSAALTPALFDGIEAIFHLVGIIKEGADGKTFQRIHVHGTQNMLDASHAAGFGGRFIYLSAIGAATDSASEYSRTKAEAEQSVMHSGLRYTIVRPSVVIGPGCEFVTQMENLVQHGGLPVKVPLPFIPIPGDGENRFQPVSIEDLTACLVRCLNSSRTIDHVYEVGGATPVTFRAMVQAFADALKIQKPILRVPLGAMTPMAGLLEAFLPEPPVTRDQLANLSVDNVAARPDAEALLGARPLSFDRIMARLYDPKPPAPVLSRVGDVRATERAVERSLEQAAGR